MKTVFAAAILLLFSGCASVINDKTHPVRFDANLADGTPVQGGQCTATNDKAHATFRTGETVQIRRSGKDLRVRCTYPGLADASGTAKSRTNGATWGNLVVGGVVGLVVDHSSGKGYTYPNWVQLVFGESRVFDRKDDEKGRPVVGVVNGQTPAPMIQVATAQDSTRTETLSEGSQVSRPPAPAASAPTYPGAGSNWRNWGTSSKEAPAKTLYRCPSPSGNEVVTETPAPGCTVIQ